MAFFNPQRVDFNPNSNIIGAVGAVGRGLYDIYQDNVKNAQIQSRLESEQRANDELNAYRQAQLEGANAHNKALLERRIKEQEALERHRNAQLELQKAVAEQNAKHQRELLALKRAELAEARQRQADEKMAKQAQIRSEALAGFELLKTDPNLQQSMGIDPKTLSNLNPDEALRLGELARQRLELASKQKNLLQASGFMDRNKLAQSYVTDLGNVASAVEALANAKQAYAPNYTGWLDRAAHNGASYFDAGDPRMDAFLAHNANALLKAKAAFGNGKMSNMQYEQFLSTFPTADEISDKQYRSKYDASLEAIGSYLSQQLQMLEASGVNVAGLKEQTAPILARLKELSFSAPLLPAKPTQNDIAKGFKSFKGGE